MTRKNYKHAVEFTDEVYYTLLNNGKIRVGTNSDFQSQMTKEEWHEKYPNFDIEEIACRGSGELKIAVRLMDSLQEFRDTHGPTVITSAYRSKEYNARRGFAKNSHHCQSIAFDVSCHNQNPFEIREFFSKRGARCFKFYKEENFVHVDWGLPYIAGFEKADDSKFSQEGRSPKQKKTDKMGMNIAAIAGGAPSVLNSVGDLGLPSWFLMGMIVAGVVGFGFYYYRSRK